jgi:hypothetical protein
VSVGGIFGTLLPVLRYGHLSSEYAALCVATVGLLLTSGMLTFELNGLLNQARLQADSAETLLLAGDIASRMAERGERDQTGASRTGTPSEERLRAQEAASASDALSRLIEGEGLAMVAQPIVDVSTGAVHAYEALARFGQPGMEGSPLRWFAGGRRHGHRLLGTASDHHRAAELSQARPFTGERELPPRTPRSAMARGQQRPDVGR